MIYRLLLAAPLCVAALAAALPAAAQTAQQRSPQNQPRPAQGQQPAQAATVSTIPQLCRIREQDILQLSRNMADRANALQRETDANTRNAISQQLQNVMNSLREAENSWNRMDCSMILYSPRG